MKLIERKTCLRFFEEKGPISGPQLQTDSSNAFKLGKVAKINENQYSHTGHHLKVQGAKTTCLAGPGKVPTYVKASFLFHPAGVLRRRLLHRNGNFVPLAP